MDAVRSSRDICTRVQGSALMNQVVSPAIALLQQLETLLRDPVLGPRVAQRVAALMQAVIEERHHDAVEKPDVDAYAKLWIGAWDEPGAELRAWISLASI